MNEIGVDKETGLTQEQVPLNARTGIPIMEQANKQTILKYEALHIAILTKVLSKDEKAAQLSSIPDAFDILYKKFSAITKAVKFTQYNSEMFYWSLYGLTHVL